MVPNMFGVPVLYSSGFLTSVRSHEFVRSRERFILFFCNYVFSYILSQIKKKKKRGGERKKSFIKVSYLVKVCSESVFSDQFLTGFTALCRYPDRQNMEQNRVLGWEWENCLGNLRSSLTGDGVKTGCIRSFDCCYKSTQ